MTYQILSDDGKPLDAHFDLSDGTIVFHSRGGSKGKNARNVDYAPALRLLLQRLANARCPVRKAWVDSNRVQSIPIANRLIADERDDGASPEKLVSLMASRMQAIGRDASSKSDHGNATKRICLQLSRELADGQVLSILRAISVERDFRSEERLPISELESVTPEHLFNAVQSLLGGHVDHGFGPSTDFDVLLEDGTRLPPKAIFGVAATEALGFVVKPRNFAAGVDSACFRILSDAGYRIVPKDTTPVDLQDTEPTDQDWEEGTPKLKAHLRRERSASLRQAKISEFRRKHQGRLFCERCNENPAEKYKTALADSCIEVHHDKTLVSEMQVGHRTRLEDLKCLCANCHRLTHREMRARQVA